MVASKSSAMAWASISVVDPVSITTISFGSIKEESKEKISSQRLF